MSHSRASSPEKQSRVSSPGKQSRLGTAQSSPSRVGTAGSYSPGKSTLGRQLGEGSPHRIYSAPTLYSAAKSNDIEAVKWIRGIGKPGVDWPNPDEGNCTPLIIAAYKGLEEVAILLIESGANLELSDKNGRTALIWAAFRGEDEMVLLLLDAGANMEARDNYGRTALLWACYKGKNKVVDALLELGADQTAATSYGETGLLRAVRYNNTEVVRLLVKKSLDFPWTDAAHAKRAIKNINKLVKMKNNKHESAANYKAHTDTDAKKMVDRVMLCYTLIQEGVPLVEMGPFFEGAIDEERKDKFQEAYEIVMYGRIGEPKGEWDQAIAAMQEK